MKRNPETPLTYEVIAYLRCFGFIAWRQNSGVAKYRGKDGNQRRVEFGFTGLSDVGAIHPGSGRFVAVETKMPGKDATTEQREFLDEVNAAGGVGIVAHSLDELHDELVKRGLIEAANG
jgi:hypothetical protein